MAAQPGYNYNTSLLPAGTGTIQPMSGGGMGDPLASYNPQQSLIPATGGEISSYKGGFSQEEPITIIGGEGPADGTRSKTAAAKTTSEPPKPATAGVKPPVKPATTGTVPPADTTPPATPSVATPSAATPSVATGATAGPTVEIKIDATGATKPADTKATDIKPTNTKNAKKDLILFGTPLTLENPSKNPTAPLSGDQLTALKLFGLDGPGLEDKVKRDVVQALYDGKCNTDKPLIMLNHCEPIRRIIQSLALNLLSKLGPDGKGDVEGITKEEKPEITYEKLPDGSMRICLVFKPNQIGLISKFAPKNVPTSKNATTETNAETKKTGVNAGTGTEGEGETLRKLVLMLALERREKAMLRKLV